MITSITNRRIKNIVQLNSSSRARREQGVFISEGIRAFMEAPLSCIREVYVSEGLLDKIDGAAGPGDKAEEGLLRECAAKLDKTGYETVSLNVFKHMSDTETPQGVLTVTGIEKLEIKDMIREYEDKDLRVLILDGLQDPGNLGTMIRTAEAAGYDLILAGNGTVDMYNPKVIRATMGSVFRVPVVYSGDLTADIGLLKAAGVKLYAAHLKGRRYYNDTDYGSRVGIMIGNEGNGLSDATASLADEYLKIPMRGETESLNAAVAAALMMYETMKDVPLPEGRSE